MTILLLRIFVKLFFRTRLSAINVQPVFLRRQYIVLTFCLFGFEMGSRMVQAHFEVAMPLKFVLNT